MDLRIVRGLIFELDREELTDEVTCAQRPKGDEGISH